MLVASGLSCNYAVSIAARTPALCSSLVLISPLALYGEPPQSLPLREYAEQPLVKALLYPLVSTRLAFILTHRESPGRWRDFAQFYAHTHQLGAEHAVMALLAGRLSENVGSVFETLRQPLLLIWGTQALEDQRNVARLRDATQKRQARTVELIQGVGICVHQEKPESVITSIQRWQEEAARPLPKETIMKGSTTQDGSSLSEEEKTPKQTLTDALQAEKETQAEMLIKHTPQTATLQAYCMKCKQKRDMQNVSEFIMKNGRLAVRGTCAVCGTGVTRIGGLS